MAIGRTILSNQGFGNPIRASYDGNPIWTNSITLDWSLFAAVSGSAATLKEGITVPVGGKYARYGQVITRVTTAHAQTVTVSGTPTGGTFSYVIIDPTTGNVATVSNLAYNASVATHQAALDAAIGSNKVTVSGSGALTANVHTITVSGQALYVVLPLITLAANNLTGGTSPTVAFAVSAGSNSGYWGPYDDGASDGRQTITQGRIAILDTTLVYGGALGLGVPVTNVDQIGAIVGGRVWRSRVLATTGSHSLANGPTWTELLAAMPSIQPIEN